MITLANIDKMFPESYDASAYSDLYKDVYGCRPRGITFNSIEEFNADFERLVKLLNEQMAEEEIVQTHNFENFVKRVTDTQDLVSGCDRKHAIEIIAEAEDQLEDMKFYGYERLEWTFNLKFGSIKKWLEA